MSYFQQIKKQSKAAYWAITVFVFLSLILPFFNLQIAPVFVFNMYSNTLDKTNFESFYVYELRVNGERQHYPMWQDHRRLYYMYTIEKYDQLYQNNGIDINIEKLQKRGIPKFIVQKITNKPEDVAAYPEWLKRYLEKNLRENINELEVIRHTVSYDDYNLIKNENSQTIIHLP